MEQSSQKYWKTYRWWFTFLLPSANISKFQLPLLSQMRFYNVQLPFLQSRTNTYTSVLNDIAFATSFWWSGSWPCSCCTFEGRRPWRIFCVWYITHESDKTRRTGKYIWRVSGDCHWGCWRCIGHCWVDWSRGMGGGERIEEESSGGKAFINNI